jgi:hypothetical protein
MEEKQNKISDKLSGFLRYGSSEMTDQERNRFEKELQADPFAEEAMEGISSLTAGEAKADLEELDKRLTERIRNTNRILFYRVAASIAVLMVLSTVYITVFRNQDYTESEKMPGNPPALEIPAASPIAEDRLPDAAQEKNTGKRQMIQESAVSSDQYAEIEEKKSEPANDVSVKTATNTQKEAAKTETEPVIQQDNKTVEAAGAPTSKAIKEPMQVMARQADEAKAVAGITIEESAPVISTELKGAASPEGGEEKFIDYIRTNINLPSNYTGGKRQLITIKFKVNAAGETSGFNITGSPDETYTKHLTGLIKNGPVWQPAEKKGNLAETEITIRITLR